MGNFIARLCFYDYCDSDRECDSEQYHECNTSLWNRTYGGYNRSIPYSNWVNTEKYKHHLENDPCYVHPNIYPHVNKYHHPPPYNPEYIPEYIKQTREASELSE